MKSAPRNGKRYLRVAASFLALPLFFVLLSFGRAQADHSFKIKQTVMGPSGWACYADVTLTYSDNSTKEQQINYNQTAEWKSSKCLKSITGKLIVSLASTSDPITGVYGQNICQNAYYEVQWVEANQRYEFVKK